MLPSGEGSFCLQRALLCSSCAQHTPQMAEFHACVMQMVDMLAELVVLGLLPLHAVRKLFRSHNYIDFEPDVSINSMMHLYGATICKIEELTTERTFMLLWERADRDDNPPFAVSL